MGLEGEIPTFPTSCDPAGSGNNKAVPPPKPRDPRYYIEDGNITFLVDGTLFKLHRSCLASQMDESSYLSDLIETQTSSNREKGTSENNPIEIPNVKASQFRSLLFVLLGTPASAEYLSLLTEANQVDSNMQSRFAYYLDINLLAMTFGMNDLGVWAHSQLKVALQSSNSLTNKAWKEDTLLQALRCAYITPGDTVDFGHDMLALLYLVLSPSASSLQESQSGFNLETCVGLFKRAGLLESEPRLFGYVFAIILSLGHQSPVWKKKLTREDRAALYAAQVHLVRLDRHEGLSLRWLASSQNLRPSVSFLAMDCHSCMKNLQAEWPASFGQCANLNSELPLHDISKIVLLPRYRQQIASAFRPAWKCPLKCGAGERMLHAIDACMENLYTELAFEYKRIVREL